MEEGPGGVMLYFQFQCETCGEPATGAGTTMPMAIEDARAMHDALFPTCWGPKGSERYFSVDQIHYDLQWPE